MILIRAIMADNTLTPYLALLIQCNVDTVTDTDDVFHRFDMDIGCTPADCFFDHVLDQRLMGELLMFSSVAMSSTTSIFLFGVGCQCPVTSLLTEIFIDGRMMLRVVATTGSTWKLVMMLMSSMAL